MFKTVWFDDNLNGKIAKDCSATRPMRPGATADEAVAAEAIHDLYNDNSRLGDIPAICVCHVRRRSRSGLRTTSARWTW